MFGGKKKLMFRININNVMDEKYFTNDHSFGKIPEARLPMVGCLLISRFIDLESRRHTSHAHNSDALTGYQFIGC